MRNKVLLKALLVYYASYTSRDNIHPSISPSIHRDTHTHTHTQIYIYIMDLSTTAVVTNCEDMS